MDTQQTVARETLDRLAAERAAYLERGDQDAVTGLDQQIDFWRRLAGQDVAEPTAQVVGEHGPEMPDLPEPAAVKPKRPR